jgi:hypothetical protein
MEIHNYVSSKEIINRLYGSTGIQDDISYYDLVNWIYSVMELLGYPMQYIEKATGWRQDSKLDFDNYVFPLPEDFHSLTAMIINGSQVRYSDSLTHRFLDGKCCSPSELPPNLRGTFTDNFGNVFDNTKGIAYSPENLDYTFTIKDKIVFTNVKKGKACIAYKAFPIDEDGFPLVPDVEKYKMAIEMFLRMKLDYIAWRNDPDSRGKKALYDDSSREYEWYIASAANHLKIPDEHRMNNLKNQLLKLAPRIQNYENYFKNLSLNRGIRG